ncbi:acyltransferase family protein [Hymenobacter humi]|uniref:Acyltransferase family protein n=1 Tax=Hymenobacter humi TaxID=1411620 RepID=A0ABW2U969_9BACT
MEPTPNKLPIRFYEIDLLRFVAAISVVFYHYTFIGVTRQNYNPLVFPEFVPITKYGYLGVELFFIISGYVVLLSAQGKTVRQFFVSRVTRLYPAYWVACTLTFLVKIIWGAGTNASPPMVDDLGARPMQYVYNMTMMQTFLGIRNMDGPYWSLAVEITFYFLISLLIGYYLLRYVEWFLLLWLGYVALPKLAYSGTLFAELFFRGYAPYFIAGMLFYLIQQPQGRTRYRYALLAVAYLLAMKACMGQAKLLSTSYHTYTNPMLTATIVTVFFLVFGLIATRKINFGSYSWLKWAGALTYPLYLLHSDMAFIAFHHLQGTCNKYVLLGGACGSDVGPRIPNPSICREALW